MPANLSHYRHYRQALYRLRAHPNERDEYAVVDRRDSFVTVYLSLFPFLIVEYYIERTYELMPGGLFFPTGFLLFWAFYYTYYKPGYLEERLSPPTNWNPLGLVTLLLGVVIWFVKVTVVEIGHLLLFRWVVAKPESAKARAGSFKTHRSPSAGAHYQQTGSWNTGSYKPPPHQSPPRAPSGLPPDVVNALKVMGLGEKVEWNEIHRRYRELAKKLHPDLNPEITKVGNRFIYVDQAYRKLAAVKNRYFADKKSP